MKKYLSVLMVLCMLLGCMLPAMAEETACLTVDEVDAFLEELREEAMQNEELTSFPSDEGFNITFAGGMLLTAGDELEADTAIVGAELNAARADLRNLNIVTQVNELPVGSSLADVLAAYPCDNEGLYGTYEEAVVSLRGSVPGTAFAGLVRRNGQQVTEVVYYAYELVGERMVRASVTYRMAENQVMGVQITAAEEVEDAQAEWETLAALQEETAYFAYPSSENGSELDPFVREDLTFSGLDFLSLDFEVMADRFGQPVSDNWMEDTDGTFIRTAVWDHGVELTLHYDSDKQLIAATHLMVTGTMLEGPRGVRVGDSLNSLLYRFRHGEGEAVQGATVLYGANSEAPYGELRYEGEGAYLTYLAQVPSGVAGLYLNCDEMHLSSYMLVLQSAE